MYTIIGGHNRGDNTMSTQENMKTVRKLYECYNTNDPKRINTMDEVCSNNVEWHDPATPTAKKGTQAAKQAETSYMTAFPNKSTTIDSMIASDDDQVIVRWHCTGTHKAPFQGVPASNRSFTITGISIYQLEDGKISEVWQ